MRVGGDDRGPAPVAFFHQLEEDVRLLGLEIEIPHFVDHDVVKATQAIEQFAR